MKIVKHIPLALSLLAMPAFAADDTVDENLKKAGESAMTNVYDALDKNTAKVDFETGSAKLTETEVASLRSLIKSAQSAGPVEKVFVGVWSDKAFSEGKTTEYTDADKALAKERATAVKKVLDEVGARDVEVVNLADKPNWIEEKIGTEKSKIKDTVAGKDVTKGEATDERKAEDLEMAAIGLTMKNEGGASKAVIVVRSKVAH